MNGKERRNKIIQMLSKNKEPISGKELAKIFGVSRQVIVQDIALLRAQDYEITSTNQGYVLLGEKKISRVFKVIHSDTDVEEELNLMFNNALYSKFYRLYELENKNILDEQHI